jgi:hypothetical protein
MKLSRALLAVALFISAAFAQSVRVRVPAGSPEIKGSVINDYGSFRVMDVPLEVAHKAKDQITILEDWDIIHLNAGAISVKGLQRPGIDGSGNKLHLIHFPSAIKPEWVSAIEASGVKIIDYIPSNAFLVYGTPSSLSFMRSSVTAADWDGPFLDSFKIDPSVRQFQKGSPAPSVVRLNGPTSKDTEEGRLFGVQLVTDVVTNSIALNAISRSGAQVINAKEDRGYTNLVVDGTASMIDAIASSPDVISIQPYRTPKKLDERQNFIIAGQLTGNGPTTGSRWLNYLAANGFTQAQFDSSNFVVDVTDDGADNGGGTAGNNFTPLNPSHYVLYTSGDISSTSRFVFHTIQGTAGADAGQGRSGHGQLNMNIVGGYAPLATVGGTDFSVLGGPHRDAAGFAYGVGVAPFVKLGNSVIFDPGFTFPNLTSIMSRGYGRGVRVSSNSWGAATGGAYNANAQAYDALVRDADPATAGNQEMVTLFAAGNNGSGANTVGAPGTAKNVITVGAAEGVQAFGAADGCDTPDAEADSANDIVGFSSRGPTDDGRRKPEIVAPGTHISGMLWQQTTSTAGIGNDNSLFRNDGVCGGPAGGYFPTTSQFFTASSGTSHSTPAVAGGAALIRQRFINGGILPPSPAMTKAVLMATARYMTGVSANDNLWSNNQGMGMMNLGTFFDAKVGTVGTTASILVDQTENFTATGQNRVYVIQPADATKPVRITLAWTDAPGSTTGNNYLNDLDLTLTNASGTFRGNNFSGANSIMGGAADPRNNAESIFLPAGASGTMLLTVTAANIVANGVPNVGTATDQDYALFCYNCATSLATVLQITNEVKVSDSCPLAGGDYLPGCRATVTTTVTNVGPVASSNVVLSLASNATVTSPSAPQTYGLIPAGSSVARNFSFTVAAGAACGSVFNTTYTLNTGGSRNFAKAVGTPVATSTSQNFDGVTAPALPTGWTALNISGTQPAFASLTSFADTAPNSVFANNPGVVSDRALVSPAFALTPSSAPTVVTFRNRYVVETGFDGGVLEMSVNGGAYQDVIAAGGSFNLGGYTGVISSGFSNPLGGRSAWTGNAGTGFITTSVNLPVSANGQNVSLRWRLGTDDSVSATGWWIDSLTIAGISYNCPAPAAATPGTPNLQFTGQVPGGTQSGGNYTSWLRVTNNGTGSAINTTLTTLTSSSGTVASPTIPSVIGRIDPGQFVDVPVTVSGAAGTRITVSAGSTFTNVATTPFNQSGAVSVRIF